MTDNVITEYFITEYKNLQELINKQIEKVKTRKFILNEYSHDKFHSKIDEQFCIIQENIPSIYYS